VVLARPADAEEVRLVSAALARQREFYKADPEAARKVVHAGESVPRALAGEDETTAWPMVANVVLNLDETVNRN
jgi:hypothetical protein